MKVYTLHWEDQEDTDYPIGIFSSRARAEKERERRDAQAIEARKSYKYNWPYKSYWQINVFELNEVEE